MTLTKWKDITGSPKFRVSNKGQIRNKKTLQIMKQHLGTRGYLQVTLARKTQAVHRIVAKEFIDNPEGLEMVNHKNHDRTNNSVRNLEWCTVQENNLHKKAYTPRGVFKRSIRPVWLCHPVERTKDPKVGIRLFPSVKSAARAVSGSKTGSNAICMAMRGRKRKDGSLNLNAFGFSWRYEDSMHIQGEVWKDLDPSCVNEAKGYKISSEGRIKSPRGRVSVPFGSKDDYPWVSIKSKNYVVHRLVAITFVPNQCDKPVVDHIDSDKWNCKADNLRWVTYSENTRFYIENKKKISNY